MSKFAVGDNVDKAADDHEVGMVIALPTVDGNFRYAVDNGGVRRPPVFQRGKTSRSPQLR